MGLKDRARSLAQLGLTARDGREARITGLAVDSREVRPGFLFAALPGTRVHGAEFAPFALRQGAAAVLTDRAGARILAEALARGEGPATQDSFALVVAEDPRQALAYAAALWFGAQPDCVVAVTGTNGKTSVATFTRQIWEHLGLPAVNIGTTGVEGAFEAPLSHTTPEPITLHRLLAQIEAEDIQHAAIEASSHGLDQRRLDGVRLTAAAFTNISQDHLDYHPDFDSYFRAKAGLFTRLLPDDGVAVVNIDDPRGAEIEAIAEERGQDVITVGRHADADMRIEAQRPDSTGQEIRFSFGGRRRQLRLPLIGDFQAENALTAAALAIASGCEPGQVFAALGELRGVRGRMQLVARRANGAAIFVDYAHTPAALEVALRALRPHVMGRIVLVFGAGGDRDRGKRPMMGRAAARHADLVIVTDDNPRSEDPARIRAEVLAGCPGALEVGDRAEAILRGVDALEPGDALLIAGKGHETGQVVGSQVFPFDDAEQASVAVAALEGRLA